MKTIIWVYWPAFIAAGIAESVFFTLIDPQQLYLLGQPVTLPPLTTYSLGFLFFWLICACASLLTWLMLPNAARQAHLVMASPDHNMYRLKSQFSLTI